MPTHRLSRRYMLGIGAVLLMLAGGGTLWLEQDRRALVAMDDPRIQPRYSSTATAPDQPQTVYHLGHSLVGRDMPAMLHQLTRAHFGSAAPYHSQLGWGTPLRTHWEPDEPITGFAAENDHDRYRDAKAAAASGDYNHFVLTEMVEIRDAIAYFDSADYLQKWATAAWQGNPDARIYLYETWHELDHPDGWLARLDHDLEQHWTGQILFPALLDLPPDRRIHIIPAGQVMAAFVRLIEAPDTPADAAPNTAPTTRADLFTRTESGAIDPIHINDWGAYLVALTHFATLYHTSPVGLPHRLTRADGSEMDRLSAETAQLMQQIVWQVVSSHPLSGVEDSNRAN